MRPYANILLTWSVAVHAAPFLNGLSANDANTSPQAGRDCHGKCSASVPPSITTQNQCSTKGGVQACCDGFAPSCLIQLLGSNCNTESYCCETEESIGGLINVNALNCAKLLD